MNTFYKSILILGFITLSAGTSYAQTSIFVSPVGKDTNPGTKEKPYATIAKAQTEARQIKGGVNIILRGGTYYLTQPVVITSQDSRPDNAPLTIKSFPGENVIISGAVAMKLKWTKYKNGIWQAKVEKDVIFDQLFVNGKLQRMARYPNYDRNASIFGGVAEDVISADREKKWSDPEGGYVHALHPREWGSYHFLINGKNEKGELILERRVETGKIISTNLTADMHKKSRFVENIFEELDAVNEWFYNKHY